MMAVLLCIRDENDGAWSAREPLVRKGDAN